MSESDIAEVVEPDPYDRRFRSHVVYLGYAPIPNGCVSPQNLSPLSSKKSLQEWVMENSKQGFYKEVECLNLEDAEKVVKAFTVPKGMIWLTSIIRLPQKGGLKREVYYRSGIKA